MNSTMIEKTESGSGVSGPFYDLNFESEGRKRLTSNKHTDELRGSVSNPSVYPDSCNINN